MFLATEAPARFLGISERLGRIAPGYRADMVALDPEEIRVEWNELGLRETCTVRDLWEKKDLGPAKGGHAFPLRPHAAGMYRIQ